MKKKYYNGEHEEKLYSVWKNMKDRCYREKSKSYKNYGGRGIRVCEEWKNDYSAFRKWAFDNGYKVNKGRNELTIDRIDNDGNYEPSNCRFVTWKEQASNKQNTLSKEEKETHCVICGKLIIKKSRNYNPKTCCRKCAAILQSKTLQEKYKDAHKKECPVCHKIFDCKDGHFKDRKYCSNKCKNLAESPIWELNNEKHRVIEWAKITGINAHCLIHRVNDMKWTIERALTTPIRRKK